MSPPTIHEEVLRRKSGPKGAPGSSFNGIGQTLSEEERKRQAREREASRTDNGQNVNPAYR